MIVKNKEKQITKIAICEKNPYLLEIWKNFLKYIGEKNHIEFQIKAFSSSNAMVFAISGKEMYDCDLLIMNTKLGENDGLQVGREFRENGYDGEIMYLTEDKTRVLESFDVSAFYYMIYWDIPLYEVEKIFLNSVLKIENKKKQALLYKGEHGRRYIKYNEIWYLKVQDKKIAIYGENEKLVDSFWGSLGDVEEELGNQGLVRIHRSYIINLRYLKKIGKEEAVLGESIRVPIGIRYQKFLGKLLVESANNTWL